MQHLRLRTTLTGLTIALAIAASGTAAIGQDEPAGATVAEVLAGSVDGTVTIEGAILGQRADDTYLFSDGTDVITIDVARSDTADEGVPTLTLMNIVGSVVDGHIEVSSWAPLEIMVPAVVRTPRLGPPAMN